MGYLKGVRCPIFNAEGLDKKLIPAYEDYRVEIGGNTPKG